MRVRAGGGLGAAFIASVAALGVAFGCRQQPKPKPSPEPKLDAPHDTSLPKNNLNLPPGTEVPKGLKSLPPHLQRELLRSIWEKPRVDRQADLDRKELVRPAPPGFKASGGAKALKLTLIAHATRLKRGESLWYRLEMQNVGTDPISWSEDGSFFKFGGFLGSHWMKIMVMRPDGKEIEAAPYPFHIGHCRGQTGWTKGVEATGVSEEDFKDTFIKSTIDARLSQGLRLALAPGETLVTRPWEYVDSCLPPRPRDEAKRLLKMGYREWPWDREFDKPGSYKIRFVMDNGAPPPPTGEQMAMMEKRFGETRKEQLHLYEMIKANSIGIFSSNAITVEVAP